MDQPAEATAATATATEETLDLENPLPSKTAELPCSLAIEFLADIYIEKAATEESGSEHTEKAVKVSGRTAWRERLWRLILYWICSCSNHWLPRTIRSGESACFQLSSDSRTQQLIRVVADTGTIE